MNHDTGTLHAFALFVLRSEAWFSHTTRSIDPRVWAAIAAYGSFGSAFAALLTAWAMNREARKQRAGLEEQQVAIDAERRALDQRREQDRIARIEDRDAANQSRSEIVRWMEQARRDALQAARPYLSARATFEAEACEHGGGVRWIAFDLRNVGARPAARVSFVIHLDGQNLQYALAHDLAPGAAETRIRFDVPSFDPELTSRYAIACFFRDPILGEEARQIFYWVRPARFHGPGEADELRPATLLEGLGIREEMGGLAASAPGEPWPEP